MAGRRAVSERAQAGRFDARAGVALFMLVADCTRGQPRQFAALYRKSPHAPPRTAALHTRRYNGSLTVREGAITDQDCS
jgi:hypothetical protein